MNPTTKRKLRWAGKIPPKMTKAIVCMKSGQNADFTYKAVGAGTDSNVVTATNAVPRGGTIDVTATVSR